MNSDSVGPILALTAAAVLLLAVPMTVRRDLRGSSALRVGLGVSLTLLIAEVAFVALFLVTLAGMPDMSQF